MSPFKYLVVTFHGQLVFGMPVRGDYRLILLIKVIHISIEDLNEKFD